jgi:NAD(P)-dependent dehydrogenase (short-subunit alcohol dehydrogenase family)
MHINGSTALVTGANRGLGRALVESLLSEGATKVYAAARHPEKLADLAGRDSRLVPLALDLTDLEQISRVAALATGTTLLITAYRGR